MNSRIPGARRWLALTAGTICLAFAVGMSGQVKSETTTTSGAPTHEVQVDRGQVVYVEGNDLVLKMDDGSLLHISNIPDSAKAMTADGKEIGIHDVKVGMTLEHTVTTTTTPKTITTVQTVSGKVWHVNPPKSVILTMDNGQNQQFNIPKGQKFSVDGQMVDAWGLKKGMKISATRVVEVPEVHTTEHRQLTASAPPPPPPDQPILIAVVMRPVAPAAGESTETPSELPKTGSMLPLLGLLGLGLLASAFGLKFSRAK